MILLERNTVAKSGGTKIFGLSDQAIFVKSEVHHALKIKEFPSCFHSRKVIEKMAACCVSNAESNWPSFEMVKCHDDIRNSLHPNIAVLDQDRTTLPN